MKDMEDSNTLTRKTFLMGAGAFLGATPACASTPGTQGIGAAPAHVRRQRPNILLIMSDQQFGLPDLPSSLDLPGHEALLKAGASFTNFHVHLTPCGPSRSTLYTGRHIQQTKVIANPSNPPYPELSPDIATVGTYLKARGYQTRYKGKWHLSLLGDSSEKALISASKSRALEPYGFSQFNEYGDPTGYTWGGLRYDPGIASDAISMIEDMRADADDGTPWFLAVNFVNPHDIMFYDATGEQEQTRLAQGFISPLKGDPEIGPYKDFLDAPLPASLMGDDLSTKPQSHRDQLVGLDYIFGVMERKDEEAWRRYRNYYFNCVRDLDRSVDVLLRGLKASGQADNTIVVFCADHGEMAGAHGLRQKLSTIYKENLRVPFIVRHPDVNGGYETKALASAVDVVPTLLSLAGNGETGEDDAVTLPGLDVSGAIGSASGRTRRDEEGILFNNATVYGWDNEFLKQQLNAFANRDTETLNSLQKAGPSLKNRVLIRGVHDGRYKFARYFAPAQHHMPDTWDSLLQYNDLELYDTLNDPDEMVNLAADPGLYKEEIERLNGMTNALIRREVGDDTGAEYPGPPERYNTV
nr:sulfatase-like hydrolase/transferase [uncultured Hyphomonas sp.]